MKKILLFAAVATMFAACTKDATKDLAPTKPTDTFYVSIGEDDSRVQLNEQMQTVWTAGDRVSVFNHSTENCPYAFTGKTGDRTGGLSYINGGTTGDAIEQVVAVYPYNSANKISADGTISTVIPTKQTYNKDGFGDGGNLMVAWSNTEKLSFRNAVGWIRVALTGDKTIKTISLFGNSQEMIAGNVTVKRDMSVKLVANSTKIIRLECGDGVALSQNNPTYFYFAMLPRTFENGLSIIVADADGGCMYIKCNDNISVKRNRIIPIAPKLHEKDDENVIAPYQLWYTTSDNKIITPNYYSGNILSNVYKDGKGVITFDCIQTGIGTFSDSDKLRLTGVTIPNSVTEIGWNAFSGCTGLTSVTIGDGIITIGSSAFEGCTGLTSITIPDSVTTIGSLAFMDCTSLTSVTIPNSVKTIETFAFSGCNGLTSITIPDSVTEIGNYAFSNCAGLTKVVIGNGVAEFGDWAFYGCTSLTSVTIADSVATIGSFAFYDCTALTSITIPGSVTTLGSSAFEGCTGLKSIYCKAITPPTLSGYAFDFFAKGVEIYVPRVSVNAYKSAVLWRNFASQIIGYDFE